PTVIFLRGLFSYLNVYFLQWAAIRAITDLRVRLFSHLLNLSASFFSRTSSGELISRIMSDTYALLGIVSNATAVIVKDPVTLTARSVAGIFRRHRGGAGVSFSAVPDRWPPRVRGFPERHPVDLRDVSADEEPGSIAKQP